MGFNKRYVPELKDLVRILFDIGSDAFYKRYVTSPDALIGSSDSLEFIREFSEEYTN
jgi:hypothetical protein